MIRIGLVDDHQLFRQSLAHLISTFNGIEVVLEAQNGKHILELLETNKPDLLLLDIQMPEMDGYVACAKIRDIYPEIKILMVSQLSSKESIHMVMESGAHGFFSKNADTEQLELAINSIFKRDYYFGVELGAVLREAILWEKQNAKHLLTSPISISHREMDVIKLASKELSSLEIADKLNINVRTVETHRKRIMEKTNSRNFIGVVLFALRHKLLTLEELA